MSPRPPPPRVSMTILALLNIGVLVCASIMIVAGGAARLGLAAPLEEALGYLANYVPELTDTLSEAVAFTPTTLIALGLFLGAAGFSGCCGAVSGGNCLMNAYAAFLMAVMALEAWIIYYAYTNGGSMEAGAGTLVTEVWNKQCRCLDGPSCVPSKTECFDPSVKIASLCEPCKDYLLASLCAAPEFMTAITCSAHVQDLVSTNILFLYYVFITVIALEFMCLLAACRIASWASAVAEAERGEEHLLAETYKHSHVSFEP